MQAIMRSVEPIYDGPIGLLNYQVKSPPKPQSVVVQSN